MQHANIETRPGTTGVEIQSLGAPGYQSPTLEIICLACEISAYAPDDDTPLF
ncbi:MAG: hypothetical protein HRU02_08960 [Myxococcales bacterium]|nr:hypothetical protein [Myxococcales bacterium]